MCPSVYRQSSLLAIVTVPHPADDAVSNPERGVSKTSGDIGSCGGGTVSHLPAHLDPARQPHFLPAGNSLQSQGAKIFAQYPELSSALWAAIGLGTLNSACGFSFMQK